MNPINDEIPAKDSKDVEESSDHLKEINDSAEASEQLKFTELDKEEQKISDNFRKTSPLEHKRLREKHDELENKKHNEISTDSKLETKNVNEHQDKELNTANVSNENSTESDANEEDNSDENMKSVIENSALESSKKLENDSITHELEHLNKEISTVSVSVPLPEDEADGFENVEDVEIPDDQDVDEIIVPDEAEAEDLTDDKDQCGDRHEEMEKPQNNVAENEEEQSLKESDVEDNESEINLQEADDVEEEEEETTKSSEAAYKDEEDDGDSDKKSVANSDAKEDTCSKSYEEPEELLVLQEIRNAARDMEQSKSDQDDLNEDSTTQGSYDPLHCTDNKEADDEAENIKYVESENSNASQTPEKDENNEDEEQEEVNSKKSDESDNENSMESEDQQNHHDENEEDDEVQFVETRNSPICIESDDDDDVDETRATTEETSLSSAHNITAKKSDDNKRIITTATTTVTVPRNIIVTRTSARKSTAKPPQPQLKPSNNSVAIAPQLQNKPKNFNYLQKTTNTVFNKRTFTGTSTQKIVDCIELLDSSDEETSSKASRTQKPTQQQRMPQKRTLLAAKGNFYKNNSNSKQTNVTANRLPHNFTPQIRPQPKKPAPPPLPPPTPQSNFLNAVQLQPAAVTNPPAFSARLSNKNVIIPNAFYGNPPNIRKSPSEIEAERRSVRWLENFLNQFCKPQFEPTHSCFVFLQRALKYKDFVRIKALRTSMNNHVQNASNQLNLELMMDLKTIFFKNVKKITNYGQRFCELTCTAAAGKAVSLITHRLSGKVTLKTSNMEMLKPTNSSSATNAASTSSYSGTTTSATRKRQLDEDEDEYTPDKSLYKTKGKPPSENGDEDSGDTGDDRKRSLRTKRTKRIDNSFSYNEDDLLAEYEIDDEDDEKLAQVEIQRKIEQKRLEAQQQRQQQAKSFESAFIQAFAKSIDGPTTSIKTKTSGKYFIT